MQGESKAIGGLQSARLTAQAEDRKMLAFLIDMALFEAGVLSARQAPQERRAVVTSVPEVPRRR
ncbi:MAG: hypothetical protein QHC90_03020 [Shinella sp.]|nr:hypothetical protein [Shinella sp.]